MKTYRTWLPGIAALAVVGAGAYSQSAPYAALASAVELRLRLIGTNDFMAAGGDGWGLGAMALKAEPINLVDLDALIAYLRALPQPARSPDGGRFASGIQ